MVHTTFGTEKARLELVNMQPNRYMISWLESRWVLPLMLKLLTFLVLIEMIEVLPFSRLTGVLLLDSVTYFKVEC